MYDDDSKNYFANRIYGNALIEKTREALLCIEFNKITFRNNLNFHMKREYSFLLQLIYYGMLFSQYQNLIFLLQFNGCTMYASKL
jgi:hypothetical protein